MNIEQCFQLGYVAKVHGLQGEVQLKLDVDDPSPYEELEHLFLEINGRLVPYFLEHLVLQPGDRALTKFEDVEDVDTASALVGKGVYLPLSLLPPLAEDQYYYHDLVGFEVEDEQHGSIGTVDALYDLQTQNLLGVNYRGKEVLIPITDGILTRVDQRERKVYTRLPEGLLDLYLED
ncbi:MAG: ribosome maturation factor RimM [Nitritalea sp.]